MEVSSCNSNLEPQCVQCVYFIHLNQSSGDMVRRWIRNRTYGTLMNRRSLRGAVLGYSHPGGESCGWQFLYTSGNTCTFAREKLCCPSEPHLGKALPHPRVQGMGSWTWLHSCQQLTLTRDLLCAPQSLMCSWLSPRLAPPENRTIQTRKVSVQNCL